MKIDELIGCFKLYTTTGLTNLHGTSFKGDFNSELLNNADKFISSTDLLEKLTLQIFSGAFFLTLVEEFLKKSNSMVSISSKCHWKYLNALLKIFSLSFITSAISFKELLFKDAIFTLIKLLILGRLLKSCWFSLWRKHLLLILLIFICSIDLLLILMIFIYSIHLVSLEDFLCRKRKFQPTLLSLCSIPESPKFLFNTYGWILLLVLSKKPLSPFCIV